MMVKCEICDKHFLFNKEVGYSKNPPLCGQMCDGKMLERQRSIRCIRGGLFGGDVTGITSDEIKLVNEVADAIKKGGAA